MQGSGERHNHHYMCKCGRGVGSCARGWRVTPPHPAPAVLPEAGSPPSRPAVAVGWSNEQRLGTSRARARDDRSTRLRDGGEGHLERVLAVWRGEVALRQQQLERGELDTRLGSAALQRLYLMNGYAPSCSQCVEL